MSSSRGSNPDKVSLNYHHLIYHLYHLPLNLLMLSVVKVFVIDNVDIQIDREDCDSVLVFGEQCIAGRIFGHQHVNVQAHDTVFVAGATTLRCAQCLSILEPIDARDGIAGHLHLEG